MEQQWFYKTFSLESGFNYANRSASVSLPTSEMDRIPPTDQERWNANYYYFVKAIASFNDLKFKRFPEPFQGFNSSDGSDVGSLNSPSTK